MAKETWREIAARIYKNAKRSIGKDRKTYMHIGPTVHPSGRQRATWGKQAHEAKLKELAKRSRENPSFLSPAELKPKKVK